MSATDELLEDTELEIFEELFHFTETIKENRQSLTLQKLRSKAALIFERLKINPIFLDDDLLQEFMTQFNIDLKHFNIEIIRIRREQNQTKNDLLQFFSEKLIELFNEKFQLDQTFNMTKEHQKNLSIMVKQAVEPVAKDDREPIQKLVYRHYLVELLSNAESENKLITFDLFNKQGEYIKALFGFDIQMSERMMRDIYNQHFSPNKEYSATVRVKLDRVDLRKFHSENPKKITARAYAL